MNNFLSMQTLGALHGAHESWWKAINTAAELQRKLYPPPPHVKAVHENPALQAIIDDQSLTRDEKLAAGRAIKEAAEKAAADITATAAVTAEPKSEITRIRRAVATLANKINRKLKNLSASFKKAWAVIKGKTILSKVNGVSFGNSQTALQHLLKYEPQDIAVELIREPNNEHDENAVGVHVSAKDSKTYQIGFLPRDLAQYMAKLIDKGIMITATFKGVTGGTEYYHNYGALIELRI